jgi:Phage integrase SAM-like domain
LLLAARPRRLHPKKKAEPAAEGKFRTTPITETIKQVRSLPKSAIIYKCAASSYWQFRVYLEGAQRKRSTGTEDEREAVRKSKLIYAEMLQTTLKNPRKALQPSSRSTLQVVANALWAKQELMVKQGELNPQKNRNDKYVYERHIKPFFKDYDINRINHNALEQFKQHIATKGLAPATQKGYMDLVVKLLRQAENMDYLNGVPNAPKIKQTDNARGYFTPVEYTRLWQTAKSLEGKQYEHVSEAGKTYRRTMITKECFELILFMRNTYIRPTDIKLLRHTDIHIIRRRHEATNTEVELLELRHEKTKGHSQHMVSNEHATKHYNSMLEIRSKREGFKKDEHLFSPDITNRDYALKQLTRQFNAVLEASGLKTDAYGNNRTLYSLRHTAITTALRDGLSYDIVASNARTSTDMLHRFYGHLTSALQMGDKMVDTVAKKQAYYDAKAAENANNNDKD